MFNPWLMDKITEPTYTNFYKKRLLEELTVFNNPVELNYGKCAVIGKMVMSSDNVYYLERIQLPHLNISIEKKYSYLELITEHLQLPYNSIDLPINKYVEIYGEINLKHESNNLDFLNFTPYDLYAKLKYFTEQSMFEEFQEFPKKLTPVFLLHDIDILNENPNELMSYNIQIRHILNKRVL